MVDSLSIKNDKLHYIQRQILHEVVSLCAQENIKYFTMGGTTLGAIRESGYIEWDDDIDIGMLRADYEHFIEVAPQKLSSDYVLMHYSTEPDCYIYFAKVMKKGTCFEEDYYSDVDVIKGIYIDIKPIDIVPDNPIRQLMHRYHIRLCEQLFLSKVLVKSSNYNKKKNLFYFVKCVIRFLLHFIVKPIQREKMYKLLDNSVKKYNNSDYLHAAFRGEKKTQGLLSDYSETIDCKFDDLDVSVPIGYDNLLINQFGKDYMVPCKKNTGHTPKVIKYE